MTDDQSGGSSEGGTRYPHAIPPFRMISDGGGALALLYVPDVRLGHAPLLDIELLTPDRLVRYLAREIEPDFLARTGGRPRPRTGQADWLSGVTRETSARQPGYERPF